MRSLRLFVDGRPSLALARSSVAGGADVLARPAMASETLPALETQAWRRLCLMVAEGRRRTAPAADIARVTWFSDQALLDAWIEFAATAETWDSAVRGDARTLAEDIVSYAKDVAPELYRRLAALLGPLKTRPPSLEEAKACQAILEALARAAEARARRAGALSGAMLPLTKAAERLGKAFARRERNPAVRVVLPHVPGMCLAHDDDGWACASDMATFDKRQSWILEPSGDAYMLISAVDPDLVLVVDQDEDLIPMTRTPPPFTFADRGPRPRVMRRDRAPANAARFFVSVSSDLYLQNVSYQTLALECPGDGGWRHGAPVVTTLKRGGATQRWAFEPPLRSRQELIFHDVIAPAASLGLEVAGLARLQDDWIAIADDLRAGAVQVLTCAERDQPFAAAGSVVDVLDGWRRLAAEARNASTDLAG
ncbi:hypothetical protein [Caulobacter sp. 1776]|uniref:hypothetical protein n=1 Tax=Caulobacter sp. 1776 TaxID=3156420 RepID=UPI0033944104